MDSAKLRKQLESLEDFEGRVLEARDALAKLPGTAATLSHLDTAAGALRAAANTLSPVVVLAERPLEFVTPNEKYPESTKAIDAAGAEYRTYEYEGQIRARWTDADGTTDHDDFATVPEAQAWLRDMASVPTFRAGA